jgi:hypothetical protein
MTAPDDECTALQDRLKTIHAAMSVEQQVLKSADGPKKEAIIATIKLLQNQAGDLIDQLRAQRCAVHPADALLTYFECTFNVRSFGAAGDGVQDDTEAVRLAIAEVLDAEQLRLPGANPAQSVLGGTVVFPPGKYRITTPIRIEKSNITLRGCGQDAAIIQYEGADSYAFIVQQREDTVQFEDLTLSQGGIKFEQHVRQHNAVRRCNFVGTQDYAIRTEQNMVVLDVYFCIFRSCAGGVFIGGRASDLIRIAYCSFLHSKAYDIYIGSTTSWVEHCDFEVRPHNYQASADAYIFIEPVHADTGGSGGGLLFQNRFGNELTAIQPGEQGFDGEIHGGPPPYAVRVGSTKSPATDEESPVNGLYNYCNVIGNQFVSSDQQREGRYPRHAHIKVERNISYWTVAANYFDAVAPEGFIIEEPDWIQLRDRGVSVKAQSNAFLNNQVRTARPVFSQGGIGWPMVDGDAQQNVWRKSAPQPQYRESNALSRDLSAWSLFDCSIMRDEESPSGMSGDAFTITKANDSSAHLSRKTTIIGDNGPWCFSVWFKANTISSVRLAVLASRDDDPSTKDDLFVTRQFENFTRPPGEWHLLYVAVGRLPLGHKATCLVGLGTEVDPADLQGNCALWDPRFEQGTRPQQRWIQPSRATDPTLATDGEIWIYDDGTVRQLRVQLDGKVYKAELTQAH